MGNPAVVDMRIRTLEDLFLDSRHENWMTSVKLSIREGLSLLEAERMFLILILGT